MASKLFYLPFRPALDANAIVVPGAKLYFYAAGTSTPQAVYSNTGLTTPLANPVEANAAGVWPSIYLDGALSYRLVLKDADGATLDEQDPYLADIADAITGDLQDLADQVATDTAAAALSAGAALVSETNAANSVGAVLQDPEVYIAPVDGLSALAYYGEFFVSTDTDYTLLRHWIVLGTGTCDVYVNVDDVNAEGPFTATTTSDSDAVTISATAGQRVSFQLANITGTPLAIAIKLEGLPA